MSTPRDLITASVRDLGVLGIGDTLPYDEANYALGTLNRFLDSLGLDPMAIFTRRRSTFAVVPNQATYLLGPSGGIASAIQSVSDGFDTNWTGAPDDWSDVSTGAGILDNSTSSYQAGGHSVLMFPSSGVAAFERDFEVSPGDYVTISIYNTAVNPGGFAGMVVQNTITANYLTTTGAWQEGPAFAIQFTEADEFESYGYNQIAFYVEPADVVGPFIGGPAPCAITVQFQASDANVRVDTFTFTSQGGLTIPRPTQLNRGDVKLINTSLSPAQEMDLIMLPDQAWQALPLKAMTSTAPTQWHYEPTFPNGTLSLYPIPTGSDYEIAVYAPEPASRFATLDDTVSLPDGWEAMLVSNLSVRLAPAYNRNPSQFILKEAADSLARVKRSNKRTQDMAFPASALIGNYGRWYDIRSDQ